VKVETTANTGAAAASPSIETPRSDRCEGGEMEATRSLTPPEVVFAPQVPFSWTLRGARSKRLRAEHVAPPVSYRIAGSARDATGLAAAIAFCNAHGATLALD
jgi:hypothetical protein